MRGTNIPARLDARSFFRRITEPHVEDSHVRPGLRNPLQRLCGRGRLAHNLEIVLGPEQVPDATSYEFMVIQQEDTHGHGRDCRSPGRVAADEPVPPEGAKGLAAAGPKTLPGGRFEVFSLSEGHKSKIGGNGMKLDIHSHTGRKAVGAMLFLLLAVGGGLLLWGSNFAGDMVHNQLSAQKISFPARGSPQLGPNEFPGLQRYAGQVVDNGPKAKAYADQFIATHLRAVAGGKTYAQISAAAIANPTNAKLAAEAQTLFQGETLRGLLLYAWGWAVVGRIAFWVAVAAFAGAALLGVAGIYDLSRRDVGASPSKESITRLAA